MTDILWIEDEIHNVPALRRKLVKKGFNIIKARTKRETIEKLNLKFDLILLDLILPQDIPDEEYEDFVGLGLLRQLIKQNNPKPIIVYTIVRDHEIEREIASYNVPFYYKGNTPTIEIYNAILTKLGIE